MRLLSLVALVFVPVVLAGGHPPQKAEFVGPPAAQAPAPLRRQFELPGRDIDIRTPATRFSIEQDVPSIRFRDAAPQLREIPIAQEFAAPQFFAAQTFAVPQVQCFVVPQVQSFAAPSHCFDSRSARSFCDDSRIRVDVNVRRERRGLGALLLGGGLGGGRSRSNGNGCYR